MKSVKPVELFLTLGLVAAVGACSAPTEGGEGDESSSSSVEQVETTSHDHGNSHSEVGEGGEGGEGMSSGDMDVDYVTSLSLMLGHLMVAEELIAAGEYELSEPHIGHPVEELYGDVEDQLGDRSVEDFKATLNSAHDLVKTSPEAPELEVQLEASIKAIDQAIAAVGEEKLQSAEFNLAVINHLLQVAGQEYAAAIADNQFVEIVEYQDSRGFVMHSAMLYEQIADQLSPETNKAMETAFAELKTAWPSVMPPEAPVKTPQEVFGYILAIEAQS
ncbi:MAG: hypothetical protein HC799_16255 [Limnothrix sp. RL_2_0]|nr:hypothetical protein [Limnothrix sp. RL_2_0]